MNKLQKEQVKKHKHKWKLAYGCDIQAILYCECGKVRSCFEDGYKDWKNSRGPY